MYEPRRAISSVGILANAQSVAISSLLLTSAISGDRAIAFAVTARLFSLQSRFIALSSTFRFSWGVLAPRCVAYTQLRRRSMPSASKCFVRNGFVRSYGKGNSIVDESKASNPDGNKTGSKLIDDRSNGSIRGQSFVNSLRTNALTLETGYLINARFAFDWVNRNCARTYFYAKVIDDTVGAVTISCVSNTLYSPRYIQSVDTGAYSVVGRSTQDREGKLDRRISFRVNFEIARDRL